MTTEVHLQCRRRHEVVGNESLVRGGSEVGDVVLDIESPLRNEAKGLDEQLEEGCIRLGDSDLS
jgi:hypothetical protein